MFRFTKVLFWLCCGLAPLASAWSAPSKITHAILVDKSKNLLHVADYVDGEYKIRKTYHTTTGKVKGDKQDEGDLKTPEGIYYFKQKLLPPSLKPKFGMMAFYIGFPNAFDQIAGRTGYDIMLHATDEPERLKKDFDSEGCVVLHNNDIQEVDKEIRVGLTPILIFSELTPEYMQPGKNAKVKTFFENWIKAWEGKDIDGYINGYHSDFTAQGKNLAQWRAYKSALNQKYSKIEVKPEDVRYYEHPKYSVITFTQNYRSKLKGGGMGHVSRGTKILFIAEEGGAPKIIAETYTPQMW